MTDSDLTPCRYESTACQHANSQPELELKRLHRYCSTNMTRADGTDKKAASCKWCGAPCHCGCHRTES